MIQARDWIMLAGIFASMLLSVLKPEAGAPFKPYPVTCMMVLLFLSFTSIRMRFIWQTARNSAPRLCLWLLLKLLCLPIALFFLVRAVHPDYALTALLLGGISTGVVAPFFSSLLGANTALVILMVATSSLLVPFTLPALVRLLAGETLEISAATMASLLAQVILVPLLASETLHLVSPSASEWISRNRFGASLALCVFIILGVFSKYADFFHEKPTVVLDATLVSVVLAAVFFAVGALASFKTNITDRLSVIISFGLINNILVVVFSSEFFGPLEPLVAVIYCIPFFGSIVFLRAYAGWLAKGTPLPSKQQRS